MFQSKRNSPSVEKNLSSSPQERHTSEKRAHGVPCIFSRGRTPPMHVIFFTRVPTRQANCRQRIPRCHSLRTLLRLYLAGKFLLIRPDPLHSCLSHSPQSASTLPEHQGTGKICSLPGKFARITRLSCIRSIKLQRLSL